MANIMMIPNWFFGYDAILELAFAIITFIVGMYALKIHKLTGQKSVKYFGTGFFLISAAYLVQSITNYLIISKLNESVCRTIKIIDISTLNNIGFYIYMLLFITGLLTLTYTTLKTKSNTLFGILSLIIILAITFSTNSIYVFYLTASILLGYLTFFHIKNFIKKKQTKTLLVVIAFAFLLFGNLHFLVSVNHSLFYMIGHFLELIAYVLILLNLIIVTRK